MAAVDLSQRYISDRFLPDKAIDLIDEAASKLRLEINSVPQPLDDVERKIRQLEIEREAIKRENDTEKIARLSEQISELGEKRDGMRARWEQEKQLVNRIQEYKNEIEEAKFQATQEERNGNYGKVAELRYGKIKEKIRIEITGSISVIFQPEQFIPDGKIAGPDAFRNTFYA